MISTNNIVFFLVHALCPLQLHFLGVLFPQLMLLLVVASPESWPSASTDMATELSTGLLLLNFSRQDPITQVEMIIQPSIGCRCSCSNIQKQQQGQPLPKFII
jgi:hypothetical protein